MTKFGIKRKTMSWKLILLSIGGIILMLALIVGAIFLGYNVIRKRYQPDIAAEKNEEIPEALKNVDLSKYPYARETDYKNPFKYMDVYSYPFQKSEDYVMNKEMVKGTDTLAQFAKEVIEDIYNTDYNELLSSKDEYEKKFYDYLNTEGGFFLEKGPGADIDIMTAADALEAIETYYIENSASSVATFETNDSLTYQDGYLFCRGVLELEVFGNDSGDKMAIPVEGVFYQDMGTGLFKFCGLVGIEGYEDFKIE